jgi:hypothetical protein
MAMAMSCREPRFLELDEAIKDRELRKQKTETGDANAPIVDHVQKFNTEEGYDGEVEWNNGFILEENEHIQKDDTEEAKKEEENERKEDSDSDDDISYRSEKDPNTKTVCCLAKASLYWYNRQTGAKYKLKRVLEATSNLVNGLYYDIRFIAEEGKFNFGQWLEPAPEYLRWGHGLDEKVVYNSGDDKPSDKLFECGVFWERSGYIEVLRCEITTKEEVQIRKDNPEEENRYLQACYRKRRLNGNQGRSLNGPMTKKQRILLLALWIFFSYIIWIVLSKIRVAVINARLN